MGTIVAEGSGVLVAVLVTAGVTVSEGCEVIVGNGLVAITAAVVGEGVADRAGVAMGPQAASTNPRASDKLINILLRIKNFLSLGSMTILLNYTNPSCNLIDGVQILRRKPSIKSSRQHEMNLFRLFIHFSNSGFITQMI